tara:strand:+ start:454 stop:654 length:201 start_codon:yes stop_codon:yes gene_type:complete
MIWSLYKKNIAQYIYIGDEEKQKGLMLNRFTYLLIHFSKARYLLDEVAISYLQTQAAVDKELIAKD